MRVRSLSAGIVPVCWEDDVPLYLLLRAYKYWDFPKGMVEPGETPRTAAQRELREETGLDAPMFRWGEIWRETPPYGAGKVARYYIAEVGEREITLSAQPVRAEHHEYRWLDYRSARALLVPRVQIILDWAHGTVTGFKGES